MHVSNGVNVPSNAQAVSAVTHPDLLRLLGWQGVMKLRQVSATLREALDNGEDGFKLLSKSIADEVGESFKNDCM